MKVKDGIIGLIIGDALGVPVEFTSREALKEDPVTDMEGYGTYNMPPGTWSDDSALAIATMASIVNKQAINYEDMMNEFVAWMKDGKYMQYHDTFDCGITTASGIYNYINGTEPVNCGETGDRDNGNGSLMRILPLAFIPDIDYESIENVSGLTHGHLRSKISCVFYIEIARSMLENDLTIDEHINLANNKIKEYYKDSGELHHFNRIFNNDLNDEDTISSKGYVIATFESVIYSLKTTDNYRDAVLRAVNLGRDTDTVAAICGGLAGIYYGYDAIPIHWIESIPKIDKVLELCERYEAYCDGCL
ncbi:ADP-ribosylglycohydrolase family protein [uncultured Methanobrevibacter sp.]|uniref:ADP-ribosylglycohydrolase family protein n=1 Tax=uncultured Methanobrevibacter sp. TaxID=253161 RepID=UPI0025D854F6|nr:ADP-ribosylglycohydrolase family protein [uncultured Methanobrevibacter sp.]